MLPGLKTLKEEEILAIFETLASECEYSPMKLAERLNLSTRQVQRYFSRLTTQTPYEWLHNIRMDRSYRALLLAETVKEVAYDLSYKQVSHFSRDFKKHFGINPSDIINGSVLAICLKPSSEELREHSYLIQGNLPLTETLKCKLSALGYQVAEQQAPYESASKAT